MLNIAFRLTEANGQFTANTVDLLYESKKMKTSFTNNFSQYRKSPHSEFYSCYSQLTNK